MALALAEAKTTADELRGYHQHRREGDEPGARCPKCVRVHNLLVEAKLATQARDDESASEAKPPQCIPATAGGAP